MVMEAFRVAFGNEHRQIRDTLLDLIRAFEEGSRDRIDTLLERTAEYTGPHFRYEEESMYPALVEIFGEEYIEKLLGDHDGAIGSARRLVEIAGQSELSERDVQEAVRLVRGLLPHVSDCDGLTIMVECLPKERIQDILDTRERAFEANLNLLEWADRVRRRPARKPA